MDAKKGMLLLWIYMQYIFCVHCASDVHNMEKEQEVERQRDKARSTKLFDSKFNINENKFNFNEPPPKVSRFIFYYV